MRTRPASAPSSPLRVRPLLDVAITLAAAAPSIGLALWVGPSLPGGVARAGMVPDVARIDRVALGRFDAAPAIASDVLLASGIAVPFIYHAIEAGLDGRGSSTRRGRRFLGRYGTDVLLLAETLAVTSLLTQVLKAAIRRPRPYSYLDPDAVDPAQRDALVSAQADNDADRSFPSGHTSTVFAMTTAGATMLTLELFGRSRWAIAAAWIGGLGISSATAALRVAAGRHFTSDVITGAAIGLGVGAAIPLAHARPRHDVDNVGRRRGPRRWSLIPSGGRGHTGAVLVIALP